MKLKLLLSLLFISQHLSAQIFSECPYRHPFKDVGDGPIAMADVDGDGNDDILSSEDLRLYLGDGQGNFGEVFSTQFEGIEAQAIYFADIDNDGDSDVLITSKATTDAIPQLYLNDGQGNFTVMSNTPFGLFFSSVASFGDIDGDFDLDLMISGQPVLAGIPVTILYQNDGQGNFSEVSNTSFIGVTTGTIDFADIDGDNDLDVMIAGLSETTSQTALYLNTGQGNFTLQTGTPFVNVRFNAVAFADVDGDNDLDVMITGDDQAANVRVTKLYINDGLGNFIEQPNTNFVGVTFGSISFADIDGDNDQDFLIMGSNQGSLNEYELYKNDGQGNFSLVIGAPFLKLNRNSLIFNDVDGDDDLDVLIKGQSSLLQYFTSLYLNDGQGNFRKAYPFDAIWNGSVSFSDIDGDEDQDVLVSGSTIESRPSSKIYRNLGEGNFDEIPDLPFAFIAGFHSIFADFDGDQIEDLFLMGRPNSSEYITTIYHNDGLGNFTEIPGNDFVSVRSGSISCFDMNGDGDKDLLIAGDDPFSGPTTKVYQNDGLGNYTEMAATNFEQLRSAKSAFADVDGDNDQDVVLLGTNDDFQNITKLYLNDGLGNFTEMLNTPFVQVSNAEIAFVDVDGDNDQDFYIRSKLYLNDGLGNFTEEPGTLFETLNFGVGYFEFADIDSDGDQDALIYGSTNDPNIDRTSAFLNDGSGNFTHLPNTPFADFNESEFTFSTVEPDGDHLLFVFGFDEDDEILSRLYKINTEIGLQTISGFSYYDINENQIKDTNEPTLSNQVIQLTPNPTFSYPTINDQYRFYVTAGDYQLTAIPDDHWELTTNSFVEVTLENEPLNNLNFGFIPTSEMQVIQPDVSSGPTRCNFDVPFWLSYRNNGTTFENGYLEFTLTEDAIFQEASINYDEISGNKLRWNYSNLAPSQMENIYVLLTMPDASNIGDTLNFVATTYLIDNNQDTTQNTTYHYNSILNCAYDPNDKAVLPAGIGDDNLTIFDSELEYRIRFQNTGTDTAFTIRIEDDLDPNLDWNTFRPVSASHPYEVDMDIVSGRVTFLFRNIFLPDSTVNEPLSHGFVKYKISLLENLLEETQITNEAAIFFDFNEPILTNMTLNTMVSTLTNTDETPYSSELTVIPNPFEKSTIIRIREIPGDRGSLHIYDTNGVLIFSQSVVSNTDVTFRKDGLVSGIYFYEIVSDKNVRFFDGKLIKY